MHEEILPRNCLELLKELESGNAIRWRSWILAGGTGLALRYGHRFSDDLDFFRVDPVPLAELLCRLEAIGACEVLQRYEHTLTVLLRGIKMSFFIVGHPWIIEPSVYRCFRLADIMDIGLMKLAAVAGRGSRKDFIDLYFILRDKHNLADLFAGMDRKYRDKKVDKYHLLRSLTWFEDAEREPMPRMISPFDWTACQSFFIGEARKIILPP